MKLSEILHWFQYFEINDFFLNLKVIKNNNIEYSDSENLESLYDKIQNIG